MAENGCLLWRFLPTTPMKRIDIPYRLNGDFMYVNQHVQGNSNTLNERHPDCTFVSVIIPVYNDQAGIDECLRALDAQTWPRECYEIIVVDNASNPPIKIDPSFKDVACILTCPTSGSYAARNAGISKAQGEVFAFTDADCFPDPDWISAGAAALERNRGRFIIGGEVALFLSQQPTAVELYQYWGSFMQRENIEHLGFSVTANLFVTRSQVQGVGTFDERLFSGGDLEWCWRAAHSGFPVIFAPEVKVTTAPRRSLSSAIRQVRRVAGGRHKLRKMKTAHINPAAVKPRRTGWAAARWILSHPDISAWNRIRIFCVALVLRIAQVIESLRLSHGSTAERR